MLSGLHDLWSVGLGIGAGLAALAAGAGIDPPAHFALAGAFVAVVSVASMRGLLAGSGRRSAASGEPAVAARWTPALMLLGAIAFASFVGEGAASDWSAVYLSQELSAAPGTAAATVRFAAALDPAATGRLVGRIAIAGYVGSVPGPIAIGWLAQATSLRAALGLVVLLALVAAAGAPAAR